MGRRGALRSLLGLAGAAAVACACAGPPTTMPAPIVMTEGLADPFDDLARGDRSPRLSLFSATERVSEDAAACAYGDELGSALLLGTATVRFGDPGWSFDQLIGRSREGEAVALGCESATEYGPLWTTIGTLHPDHARARASQAGDPVREPAMRFAADVDRALSDAKLPEIVVFVSGFNTTFAETVERLAQFSYFSGRSRVFLAYSWPTKRSFLSYLSDSQKGAIAVGNLRRLILFLAEHTAAERIHFIGYSAGAQILADALLQVRLMHHDAGPDELRRRLRIGRVLYPAADLDVRYARSMELDRIGDLPEATNIYVSTGDLGIWASARLLFGAPRLGSPDRAMTERDLERLRAAPETTAFIDADRALKAAGGDSFGHGYWYTNPWVNTDVILFLGLGLSPSERGLVRSDDGTHWVFPPDYPERLRAVKERLEAEAAAGRAR